MLTEFFCSLNCVNAEELRNKVEVYQVVLLHTVMQDHEVVMKIPYVGWRRFQSICWSQHDMQTWPLFGVITTQTSFWRYSLYSLDQICPVFGLLLSICLSVCYPAELKWIRIAGPLPPLHSVLCRHGQRQKDADEPLVITESVLEFCALNCRELVLTISICRARSILMCWEWLTQ